MNIYVLDPATLDPVDVVDEYKSIIWTRRYYDAGDFELYIPATKHARELFQNDVILYREQDAKDGYINSAMFVKRVNLVEDPDDGDMYSITGPDLKSILGRRVVWGQKNLTGSIEDIARQLITENIISPTNAERKIDNFLMEAAAGLTNQIDVQLYGDNLQDFLRDSCTSCQVGWDIRLKDKKFYFRMYEGVDHSFRQKVHPWVIFSPDYDNLLSSEYDVNYSNFHNVAMVAGEGQGTERQIEQVGNASGMNRYEMYVDAGGVSSNNGEIDAAQYTTMIKQEGVLKLYEYNHAEEQLANEVDTEGGFKLGQDYDLGDIVQVVNRFGYKAAPRITEIIDSEDNTGRKVIPTFSQTSRVEV